jgi:hypothetical protein
VATLDRVATTANSLKHSTYVGHPLWGFSLHGSHGFRRQLQNRCLLTRIKMRQEHNLTIRKLKCIVMSNDERTLNQLETYPRFVPWLAMADEVR